VAEAAFQLSMPPDLPKEVRDSLTVYPCEELGQVLALTLRGASFREGRLMFGEEEALRHPPVVHGPEVH